MRALFGVVLWLALSVAAFVLVGYVVGPLGPFEVGAVVVIGAVGALLALRRIDRRRQTA